MIHQMKLVDFAFKKMKAKEKIIEIRLNDEKRQLINTSDIIEFKHIDTGEILKTKVINLYKFNTFKELFESFNYHKLGLTKEDNYLIMDKFYSKEDQNKYEALAIEIQII